MAASGRYWTRAISVAAKTGEDFLHGILGDITAR